MGFLASLQQNKFIKYAWFRNVGRWWHVGLAALFALANLTYGLITGAEMTDRDWITMVIIMIIAALWEVGEWVWRNHIKKDLELVYAADALDNMTARQRFYFEAIGDIGCAFVGGYSIVSVFYWIMNLF